MNRVSIENLTAAGSSLLTIVAPKFCCWTSAMAALASGSSYLAWVHPMRYYLFIFSFLLLGYSFFKLYNNTDAKKGDKQCRVCRKNKVPYLHSKFFTWLATVLVVVIFLVNYLWQ